MTTFLVSSDGYWDGILGFGNPYTKVYVTDIDDIYKVIDLWCKELQYVYDKESVVWKVDDNTIHFKFTEDWNKVGDNYDFDMETQFDLYEIKWVRTL